MHKCKCGGRLKRIDLVSEFDPNLMRFQVRDLDALYANWRCDKCGILRTQRKRQSKKAEAEIGLGKTISQFMFQFICPVCNARFPSLTETDWDKWFEHLVEEKKKAFDKVLNK